MAPPKIKLYVDIVSPFAYIGYHILRNNAAFKNCEITYVPVFLGGIMKACNNSPPINIKNKDKWIEVERKRWSKYFNVSMGAMPEGFPVNTLLTMRVLTAVYQSHPDKFTDAVDALYAAFWGNANKDKVNTPEGLTKALSAALGEEVTKQLLQESSGDKAKKGLTQLTDQAFNDGAFGLPYFVATNPAGQTEAFWGVDHLGQLCDHLGIERGGDRGMRAMI